MTTQTNLGKVWAISSTVSDPGDTKYALGWVAEIPTFQNFNFVLQNFDKNLLALAEKGGYAWQSNITYAKGAMVIENTVHGLTKFYSKTTNPLISPITDTLENYWTKGETWGNPHDYNKTGLTGNNITERLTDGWTSSDMTLRNTNGAIQALISGNSTLLFGNAAGTLVVMDGGSHTSPDGRPFKASHPDTYRIFHEGHLPTQEEVPGTIPANNAYDGVLYGRRNENWVKVTTTSISEFPPQPVIGDGAGWYNKQDATFYLDIDDGDSSQWVPASPPATPLPDASKFDKTGGTITGNTTVENNNPYIKVKNSAGSDGSFFVADSSNNIRLGVEHVDGVGVSLVFYDLVGGVVNSILLNPTTTTSHKPVVAPSLHAINGFSGTVANPSSITVVDGIITAMS